MDDNLKLVAEYMLRAWNALSPEWWGAIGLWLATVGTIAYRNSKTFKDRAVSRKKSRAKHQKALDDAQAAITQAFEYQVQHGHMTREDVNYMYEMIRSGCPKFKDLGPEPNFGRPWYYGPKMPESAAAVKAAIMARLTAAGMSTKELWDKKKRIAMRGKAKRTAQEDQGDLMAAIRKSNKAKA